MTLEFGVILSGLITNNLLLSVGWVLLKMGNMIPIEYEGASVLIIILFGVARKILNASGVK